MKDSLVKGRVTIRQEQEDGSMKVIFDKHNLVVNGGRALLARLISVPTSSGVQTPTPDYYIDHIKLGSGAPTSDPQSTLKDVVSPLKTTAGVVFGTIPCSSYSYSYSESDFMNGIPTNSEVSGVRDQLKGSQVVFSFNINKGDLQDPDSDVVLFNEMGLYLKNNVMFAYEKFAPVYKTSSRAIAIDWTISF